MGRHKTRLLEIRRHLRLGAVSAAMRDVVAWSGRTPRAQRSDEPLVLTELSSLMTCAARLQRFSVRLGSF